MPVFFLYFSEHLSLPQVLRLEALYYVTVVILEVPSGYFSDRVGRKPTLVISALALILSYSFLSFASAFWMFAAGQMLFAVAFSFRSGTDVSFHYDSVVAADREGEFGALEARVERNAFLIGAVSAVIGGIVGMIELRYAYICSFGAALVALWLALRFTEPRLASEPLLAHGVSEQAKVMLHYMRDRFLLWLFGFLVLMNVLNHIPYELFQPYISSLLAKLELSSSISAGATGIHYALTMLVGSYFAALSITIRERIGLYRSLIVAAVLQTAIITLMCFFLHPLIAILMLLRSSPRALTTAPINAAIAPLVKKTHRATYLSLQSLIGRLAYGMFLYFVSLTQPIGTAADWNALSEVLFIGAVIGGIGLICLVLGRKWVGKV